VGQASQNESTDLARGQLNGDELAVQLIRPADIPSAERTLKPAVVRIIWPPAPTVVSPTNFPNVAAFLTPLFTEAHITLAAIKAWKL
jgi:hypothetical protein